MADRALTEDALIAGLRDIRLPPDALGGLIGEVLAALALGLLIAAALGLVLRLLTQARGAVRHKGAAVEDLSEDAQRLALLRQLKILAPDRYALIRETLYQPDGLPTLDALRQEVQRHV